MSKHQDDYDEYVEALKHNDIDACLYIETIYGLDGYPPNIVCFALEAAIAGKDMHDALDELMG